MSERSVVTLIAAIITAVSGLVGVFGAVLLGHWLDRRHAAGTVLADSDARTAAKRGSGRLRGLVGLGVGIVAGALLAAMYLRVTPPPPSPPPSPTAARPIITSVEFTWLAGATNAAFAIHGQGLGTQDPYQGDSEFFIIDNFTRGWAGGHRDASGQDSVITNVSHWDDRLISVDSLGGLGTDNNQLDIGDSLEIRVWNPQTGLGPAYFDLSVPALGGVITGTPAVPAMQPTTLTVPGDDEGGAVFRVPETGTYRLTRVAGAYSPWRDNSVLGGQWRNVLFLYVDTVRWGVTSYSHGNGLTPDVVGRAGILGCDEDLDSQQSAEDCGVGGSTTLYLEASHILILMPVDIQGQYPYNRGEVTIQIARL